MIILTTALLFHICAKHDLIWEGVTSAWIFAAVLDGGLWAFLMYCVFC